MKLHIVDSDSAAPPVGFRAALRSLGLRRIIASKDRREAAAMAKERAAGPSVAEREAELVEFWKRFEDLIEALCLAAQLGPTQAAEARYAKDRAWLRERYPSIRRFVVAYLDFSVDDSSQCIDFSGLGGDAFEALTEAESLERFLELDDGGMISRIERTREALERYRDHLRWLAPSG